MNSHFLKIDAALSTAGPFLRGNFMSKMAAIRKFKKPKAKFDDSLKKIERGQHFETTLTCFKEHFYHKLNLPLDEVRVHAFLSTWRPEYFRTNKE